MSTEYPFYTEGPKALLDTRIQIANYSIARAALRLQQQKQQQEAWRNQDQDAEMDWTLECSEIGDDRPLSGCSISPDGTMLATCGLSEVAKLWSIITLMPQQPQTINKLKGHKQRLTDIKFSPIQNNLLLATASADKTAKLWNTRGNYLKTFEGHLDRLARIAFHPLGNYLGTTSFDKTWRFWDVETGVELLLQEGHSRGVYGIDFHRDGSLAATCGLDSTVRVWDLRIGTSIVEFEGHAKPVLDLSFSPNGFYLASGGEDNSCRIWDLRKKRSVYVIPAHLNLISSVKFEPQQGLFLVTGSFDTTAKVWSGGDEFKHVSTLSGHEGIVTCVDVAGDGHCVTTVSHDRTIKLWTTNSDDDEDEENQAMDIQ